MLIREAPALVTGGYACLLEDMKIKVVMRWQRSSSLLSHKHQNWESAPEHFMRSTTHSFDSRQKKKKETASNQISPFILTKSSLKLCVHHKHLSQSRGHLLIEPRGFAVYWVLWFYHAFKTHPRFQSLWPALSSTYTRKETKNPKP